MLLAIHSPRMSQDALAVLTVIFYLACLNIAEWFYALYSIMEGWKLLTASI